MDWIFLRNSRMEMIQQMRNHSAIPCVHLSIYVRCEYSFIVLSGLLLRFKNSLSFSF